MTGRRMASALVAAFGIVSATADAATPVRAVQLDLARQTETVPVIEAFTRKAAAAGYNTLVLYLEGRVATKSFAMPNAVAYSADEMRRVVRTAAEVGVDVVPVVSVLGHAEQFFTATNLCQHAEERSGRCRFPASVCQTFCLNQPKARDFLEKYLSEIAAIFPSKNLHLGLDESFQFGFCDTCRARREEIGFGRLFNEYVKWADGLCRRLGKRMWMWDDMYEFFPEALEDCPRDIVMCHWIYDDDVTEWGHRGHFVNRRRIDWLARYEKLGMDALPVSGPWADNMRSLKAYAARHRTIGFYVAQWELSDMFYGPSMVNLVGLDAAFPSLSGAPRRAAEYLADTWGYGVNGNFRISQMRRGDRLAVDSTFRLRQGSALRLALDVLKASPLFAGDGAVSPEALSEPALADDLVTHFEQLSLKQQIDAVAPALLTPRRTAEESRTAKAGLRVLLPEMERLLARRKRQETVWRPGQSPNALTAPMKDSIAFVNRLLAVPAEADEEEWVLELSLSLPDFHGRSCWTVEGLFDGEWRVLTQGVIKPTTGNWANFERKFAFRSAKAPAALRIGECGYGEAALLFASVWNRSRRLVPLAVRKTEGRVQDAENVLTDDWRSVRFGFPDRAIAFARPEIAELKNVIECSLKEDEWHVR